jgi:hypothetical protein
MKELADHWKSKNKNEDSRYLSRPSNNLNLNNSLILKSKSYEQNNQGKGYSDKQLLSSSPLTSLNFHGQL